MADVLCERCEAVRAMSEPVRLRGEVLGWFCFACAVVTLRDASFRLRDSLAGVVAGWSVHVDFGGEV